MYIPSVLRILNKTRDVCNFGRCIMCECTSMDDIVWMCSSSLYFVNAHSHITLYECEFHFLSTLFPFPQYLCCILDVISELFHAKPRSQLSSSASSSSMWLHTVCVVPSFAFTSSLPFLSLSFISRLSPTIISNCAHFFPMSITDLKFFTVFLYTSKYKRKRKARRRLVLLSLFQYYVH